MSARNQLVDSLRRLRAAGPDQYRDFMDAFRLLWSEQVQAVLESPYTDLQNRQGQAQLCQLLVRLVNTANEDPQRK